MTNRKFSSPILTAVVLSLFGHPPLLFGAALDPAVQTYSTPAASNGTSGGAQKTPASAHTVSYTVLPGESLTSIARKFNTTRKKLRSLNNLTASTVKPGQILLVPSSTRAKTSLTASGVESKTHHTYLAAQPVQDFDVPASTFASCPVPLPSPDDDPDSPAPVAVDKPAPIAKLVSPAELAAETSAAQHEVAPAPAPLSRVATAQPGPLATPRTYTKNAPTYSTGRVTVNLAPSGTLRPSLYPPAAARPGRTLSQIFGFGSPSTVEANDWGTRFLQQARALGDQGIEYDEDWRPPGESRSWTMDCSNTTRYLYKVTAGIELPRTASDQYYYLHLQGKAWDVPQTSRGWADTEFLRQNLKPGDLLFWENTYRPERQPPITHVMVYLGSNDKGQWIMAGSQSSRGGEHNRRNGGPDVYVFRPGQPCGGYTTWLGLVHHQGRFCAFGRPLEADRSKLSVAATD
jgi:cell wall-associated NlpC family hydrolase